MEVRALPVPPPLLSMTVVNATHVASPGADEVLPASPSLGICLNLSIWPNLLTGAQVLE